MGRCAIREGALYEFTVVDDGVNLSMTITEAGDPRNTASVTSTLSKDVSRSDFVGFYNRESSAKADHHARLEDVVIEVMGRRAESSPDGTDGGTARR